MTSTGGMISNAQDKPLAPNPPGRWGQLLKTRQPASLRVIVAVIVVGLLFDLAVRSSNTGVATALLFVGAAVALAVVIWPTGNRGALTTLAVVPLFAVWLMFRSSEWLLPLDILAVLILLCVAASFASGGNPLRLTIPAAVLRAVVVGLNAFLVIPFLSEPLSRMFDNRAGKWVPIIRGLFIAAPAFLILLFLLMSADAVFASIFDFDLNLGGAINHLLIIAVGVWLFATLARTAMAAKEPVTEGPTFRIGATEGLIAVGSLVLLFGVFALSQLITWIGGADNVLQTAGLTYAQHAREGFFQLLAVAVITLGVLMTARATTSLPTDTHRRWFKTLGLAAVALILAIVAVALRRLALYEDAYGLTMLRLYSTVFAVWIAVVFVMFGVVIAEVKRTDWFVGAGTAVALVFLFAMNVLNPEAFVVDRNFDRQAMAKPVPIDSLYVTTLSTDATPALLARVDELPAEARDTVVRNLCQTTNPGGSGSWTEWNWSANRAEAALSARNC